tara:strand:- start:1 stop:363 length:363 start_codon:yes stop_codon:yes gene_type:complete
MAHNNKIKWNISLEEGIEIAHKNLIEILRDNSQPMYLTDITRLLNTKTKAHKIHNNKRHNCFTKYLKMTHGGIVNFLDTYTIYGIIDKEERIKVILLEDQFEGDRGPLRSITKDNEWVFV